MSERLDGYHPELEDRDDLRVLVVGDGAREHALAWAVARSPRLARGQVFMLGENAGAAEVADLLPLERPDQYHNPNTVLRATKHTEADLVLLSSDRVIAYQAAEAVELLGRPVFGFSGRTSEFEWDKETGKRLNTAAGVNTPPSRAFRNADEANRFLLDVEDEAVVIAAAYLADGKGVWVCRTREEAAEIIERLLVRRELGLAGAKILIQKYFGAREELSSHTVVRLTADGVQTLSWPLAGDYKKRETGNYGGNTGGMGSYVPHRLADQALHQRVMNEAVCPLAAQLPTWRQGAHDAGLLFGGHALSAEGELTTFEWNARHGHPETQAYMVHHRSDPLDTMIAAINGRLDTAKVDWHDGSTVGVVVATEQYARGRPEVAQFIEGIDEVREEFGVEVFQDRTQQAEGRIRVRGGQRIVTLVAQAETAEEASRIATAAAEYIRLVSADGNEQALGTHYRTDIGVASNA